MKDSNEITVDTCQRKNAKNIPQKNLKKLAKSFAKPQKNRRNILSTLASALSELQVSLPVRQKIFEIIEKNSKNSSPKKFTKYHFTKNVCTEGPCVVLCGIKHAKTGKEPFQKALRSILDYCGRKPKYLQKII